MVRNKALETLAMSDETSPLLLSKQCGVCHES